MNYALFLPFLAFALVLSAFLSVSRLRLRSLITLFQLQAFILALYACVMGVVQSEMQLIVIAGLIFLLKVVLMPAMLYRVVRDAHVSERLATYVRPTTLSFIAVLAISFSAFVGLHLPFGNDAFALSIALALALIGFEFLIVHKNLLGQGIGFLVLENGIFFFGLAVVGGVPFFVECGVMFDLLALFVLAIALIRRTQQAHSSVSTDFLTALNDL